MTDPNYAHRIRAELEAAIDHADADINVLSATIQHHSEMKKLTEVQRKKAMDHRAELKGILKKYVEDHA